MRLIVTAAVAAALVTPACRATPTSSRRTGESGSLEHIASGELLRRANHGRTILDADGRFVLPPRVTRVWIDVGAHLLETTQDELKRHGEMALIAVEPLEECWRAWPDRTRLLALPVAISTERGWLDFHVNANNSTSSLLKTVDGNMVAKLTKTVETRKVPVLRLEDVLERIPPDVDVEFLKTDVQGHDLQVLKSAGAQLRRVRKVKVEVINVPIYDGSGDWRPGTEAEFVSYMTAQGFAFEGDTSVRDGRVWLDKWFVNRTPPPGSIRNP